MARGASSRWEDDVTPCRALTAAHSPHRQEAHARCAAQPARASPPPVTAANNGARVVADRLAEVAADGAVELRRRGGGGQSEGGAMSRNPSCTRIVSEERSGRPANPWVKRLTALAQNTPEPLLHRALDVMDRGMKNLDINARVFAESPVTAGLTNPGAAIPPDIEGVVFKIQIFSGRDVNAYSSIPTEDEILLSPNHVTSEACDVDGYTVIDLVQLASCSTQSTRLIHTLKYRYKPTCWKTFRALNIK